MPPPPRPPIICYDLRTNCNARRTPCARDRVPASGTARKARVTVVQREPPEATKAGATTCWHHHNIESFDDPDELENIPTSRLSRRSEESRHPQKRHESHFQRQKLVYSEPYKFRRETLPPKVNINNTRHAYGQKLRVDTEERGRRQERRRERIAMAEKLEEIETKLEALERWRRDLLKTFGMSHNTARYIQKQDEEFANLKKKVDQFSRARSQAICKRVQETKQINQPRKVGQQESRDLSRLNNSRQALSSTLKNSISTKSPTNTNSSSSTISISSCSSPISSEEHRFLPPSPKIIRDKTLTTPKSVLNSTKQYNPLDKFSFYKVDPKQTDSIIEVSDMDYFEMVEDKTMMEVNELMNRMQSMLKEVGQESIS